MKIVCIGSSSVEGIGDSRSIGWVGRLNKQLNAQSDTINEFRVFNLGFKGDSISQTKDRYLAEVPSRNPHLVIIFTGTNDVRIDIKNGRKYKFNPNYMQDWENFLSYLQNTNHKTLILGPTMVNESKGDMVINERYSLSFLNKDISIYNDELKELCKKHSVDFLELFNVFSQDNINEYSFDCVHPNSKGYDMLTEVIINKLNENKII